MSLSTRLPSGEGGLHLALIHGWVPPFERFVGTVRYLGGLAKGLSESGHRVTVTMRDEAAPRVDRLGKPTVQRVAVPHLVGRGRIAEAADPALASRVYPRAMRDLHARDTVDLAEYSNYVGDGTAHASDGETGLLGPAGEARALTRAMLKLAQSAEFRLRLGTAGLGGWHAEFTEERLCEQTTDAYKALRAGRPVRVLEGGSA